MLLFVTELNTHKKFN